MSSDRPRVSKAALWTGRVLSAVPVLMGLMGLVMFLTKRSEFVKGMTDHGYPGRVALPLLIVQLACTLLYAIPQTAILGAVLLTAWLGGAVATHVRADDGMWFVPVAVGVIVWLGVFLRDARLRSLLPLRRV
jgi:hypothetical protein